MRQISKAILVALASMAGAAAAQTSAAAETSRHTPTYRVTILSSLGGTNSRGNSINNLGLVAGYSTLPGNQTRHASAWLFGNQFDLGTLGGANSSVPWPVKNSVGLISGISETGAPNPLGEKWSCGYFFNTTGNICVGFVWSWGTMHALPTLGGYNGFATGTNNWGQTVGWAENTVHDSTCDPASGQVLQFKPVVWELGRNQARELPLIAADSSGAATALNDRGQVVGISGACDQAQGRRTAAHAVLWENGRATDIGNLGTELWNTPMAINQRGDIAGFAGTQSDDLDGNFTHAFLKTRESSIQDLGVLAGDVSSTATGINEHRQVVGYSNDADGNFRAFIWQNGTMTALKDLAPDYAGDLVLAEDINDAGMITGRARDPVTRELLAFVAMPVSGHR